MNDTILINYSPFTLESDIYILKNGEKIEMPTPSEIGTFVERIVDIAYAEDIYDVKIASMTSPPQEFWALISEIEKQKYSNHKINVMEI